MSLIDEALKRAQAADLPAATRPTTWAPTHMPARAIGRGRVAIWGTLVLIATLAGVWALSRPREKGLTTRPQTNPPVRPAITPENAAGSSTQSSGRAVAPVKKSEPAALASARVASESRRARNPSLEVSSASSKAGPPSDARPATKAAAVEHAPQGLVDGKSYSGDVALPNGSKIELGGIVYSDESPVALLNGRIVAPGVAIEGMTVSKIEPDRVELQGHGVSIFLLLK